MGWEEGGSAYYSLDTSGGNVLSLTWRAGCESENVPRLLQNGARQKQAPVIFFGVERVGRRYSHQALVPARVPVVLSRVEKGHRFIFQEKEKVVTPPRA